jgi:hypothetical protein
MSEAKTAHQKGRIRVVHAPQQLSFATKVKTPIHIRIIQLLI